MKHSKTYLFSLKRIFALLFLIVGLVALVQIRPSISLPSKGYNNKSEIKNESFISEQGILASPIKVEESNSPNYKTQNRGALFQAYVLQSNRRSDASVVRHLSAINAIVFSVPIYISLHRLII